MQGIKKINNYYAQNNSEIMRIKKLNLKNYEDNFELMETRSVRDIQEEIIEKEIKAEKRRAFEKRFERLTQIKKKHYLT